MKANSRRRVLISSVAMLLVAIVALGTSTYAWFTNATTAKANGISVTANAAKGLQIRTEAGDDKWGTNQTWATPQNFDNTISPLSVPYTEGSAMPKAYYASQAGVDGAWSEENAAVATYEFVEKSFDAPTSYVNSDDYYLSYMVDARVIGDSTGGSYELSAQIAYTGTGDDPLKDVIRIAVTDNEGVVYGVYGDEAVNAITSTKPDIAATASAVKSSFTCGTVSSTARTLYVYIWIEGQDAECIDEVMSATGSYNITFSAPDINS